ncbi:MAG: elongation factor G [Kiritimatiellaeota bacterium]|nr:elongation factor G [Kiritimatiellota bacterium]
MKDIPIADVRNFVYLGHTGSGKTQLLDAILYKLGVNDRLGSPADGTSMADWSDEEKARKITIWSKSFNATYPADGRKIRLVMLDTPGYADFYGQLVAASAIADAALICVDAVAGPQVGTQRAWRRCEQLGLPCGIVITGLDRENADFTKMLATLQGLWGSKCIPAVLPGPGGQSVTAVLGGQPLPAEAEPWRTAFIEAAAETSDALTEKYLAGEALSAAELAAGLRAAVNGRKLMPVFATVAKAGVGVPELLTGLAQLFPSPADRPVQDAAGQAVDITPAAPFCGLVWRAINDPFIGQLTFLRVYGGTLKPDSEIYDASKQSRERIGALLSLNGRKQEPMAEAHAGDIVALAKLKTTVLNNSLCAAGQAIVFAPIKFPAPVMAVAVTPKTQGDDDKLGTSLHRATDEDPTLKVERNAETHEMILSGMGDIHLDVVLKRMKTRSNVDVLLSTPKVPYKETITGKGEGHYKHKKQSGGRGQFGEVYLRVEPLKAGDAEWFVDDVVGGAIPGNFLPAVRKGLEEGLTRGVLAHCPVVHTKVSVYDGSYHEVDSSEISFKIAGMRAFSDAMAKAKPVLLEPIMKLKVLFPDQYMGDITGDLNHKRGRILGMGAEDGMQFIIAEVPQAEVFKYASELRSITHGRGSFEMEFLRSDVVPQHIAQKVIAEAQKHKTEEAD